MTIYNTLLKHVATLAAALLLALSFTVSTAFADELKDISKMAEQGQQEAALKRINAYLKANPKDAQGMFMKGIILAESGQRDAAIKTFDELTKKYPSLPEPYNNLAVLHAEAGQYEQAKKALETAIKTHPSYATAHENLGNIYARMASEAYDKALKLDNSNSRAQSKLSLIKDLFGTGNTTTVATKTAKNTGTKPIRPSAKTPAEPTKATAKPPVVDTVDNEADITTAVSEWTNAWSSQDIDQYLASYADSFVPAKGRGLKSWKEFRRGRVTKPSQITLELSNQKIDVTDDDNAKVSFKQYYKADGRPIHTNKTLILKKVGGAWLIDKEIASN